LSLKPRALSIPLTIKVPSLLQGQGAEVSNANSAWVAKEYTLLQEFLQALQTYYSAQVEPITNAQVSPRGSWSTGWPGYNTVGVLAACCSQPRH
jgi:serine protease inhibitor